VLDGLSHCRDAAIAATARAGTRDSISLRAIAPDRGRSGDLATALRLQILR
jgi:hypothetical protein